MSHKYSFYLAVLFSALLASPAAAADKSGAYVNIGITQLSADVDLTDTQVQGQIANLGEQSLDITMVTGRVGYRLNDYLAIEGEAGFGLGGDDFNQAVPVNVGGTNINVDTNVGLDVDNYFIGFARGIFPVSEQVDIFIRGGYGTASAEADITASAAGLSASGSVSDSFDGFAYGIGGQFNFTNNDGIRADYTRLEDTNIISLAYARRF